MTDTTTNTGRRTGLDRADMVATALALVENEGPGALTMRRLAAELDVTTNTVYWHVGSRDALIAEIIRTSATRLADRVIAGATPLLEHHLELALVHEIEAAGLRGNDAALALRSILSTVGGFLVGALRDESSSPAELRPAALWSTTSGGVSDETIQALSLPTDHEAVFTTTLDAVVAIHIPA